MNERRGGSDQETGRILVASNRGPVSFRRDVGGALTVSRGGGGLVSGLSSVAATADLLWICAALSDADRAAARQAPGGRLDLAGYHPPAPLQMPDIAPQTFNQAYNSVANSTLWFIHHLLFNTPNQPRFGTAFMREWDSYREYNAAFAKALADSADTHDVRAMVQDYHLALAPRMLAELRPDVRIAHFSHTPW